MLPGVVRDLGLEPRDYGVGGQGLELRGYGTWCGQGLGVRALGGAGLELRGYGSGVMSHAL